jgi:hypothetical protein
VASPADRVSVAADADLWLINPVLLPFDQAPRQSDAPPSPLADARLQTPELWPLLAAPAGPAARILAQPQTLAASSAPHAPHPARALAGLRLPVLDAPGLAPPGSVALTAAPAGHAPQDPLSSSSPLPVAPAAVSAAATGSGSSLTSGGSSSAGATLAFVGALLLHAWRVLQRLSALEPPSIVPPTLTPPR